MDRDASGPLLILRCVPRSARSWRATEEPSPSPAPAAAAAQPAGTGTGVPCRQPHPHPQPGTLGGRGRRWGQGSRLVALRKDTWHGHHCHRVPGGRLRLAPPALLRAVRAWVSSGCQGAHPASLAHTPVPGRETLGILQLPAPTWAGLEPGEVPRTTAAPAKRRRRMQAQAPVGQGQPTGATVGGEQPFILPPQKSPAPPTATSRWGGDLMLGVSFFPLRMEEKPAEIWVRPRLRREQSSVPRHGPAVWEGTSSHPRGPACAPVASRTRRLPRPQL